MSQYFENDPKMKSEKRSLILYINDDKLVFTSDVGVFSNDKIDYGSYTFLKSLLKEDKVDTLLDVGCGYGTLGITLKYFNFANSVDMLDVNERAVGLALENASNYKLDNVNCFVSDGFAKVDKSYDCIVINPPIRAGKVVIYQMFTDASKHLNSSGRLYIVIKKDLGGPSAIKKLEELFNKVEVINKDKGYLIIKAFN